MDDNESLNLKDEISQAEHPICLSDEEPAFSVIEDSIFRLWEVVNNLTSIQPPKRKTFHVTIFGSARIHKDTPLYNDIRYLASELTLLGCDIVTGGGPGLMEAANEGSVIADPSNQRKSIGIRINLYSEQDTNPFVEHLYQHRTFFSRLHHFVLLSDAFIVVPGGIGTTLEAMMIWQLLQVRHLDKPLIMIGKMWSDLVDWATKNMVESELKLANSEDMKIPHCVDSVEEAIILLRQAHTEWIQKNVKCDL
jgi:hypothetical protein